jgi:4-amino-4-deoxy-L-arabinose transferase-like glycosyltransferase
VCGPGTVGESGDSLSDGDSSGDEVVPVTGRAVPFGSILAAEVALAVASRVAYALTVGRHLKLGLDSTAYILLGGSLASGQGYSNPALLFTTVAHKATANFVPGYPVFLLGLLKLGITTTTGFRLAGAVCGGVTVLLTGYFGSRITGRPVIGLIAAGLVAVSPALIAADGSVMSETIAVPLTVGVLLTAEWAAQSTSLVRWALVGAVAGALVLVRSEDVLIVVVLVPVAVAVAPKVGLGRRALQAGAAVLVAVAVLAPWVIRNHQTFTPTVLLSSNGGKTLAGANCPTTYQGPLLGYWDYTCIGYDQLAVSDEARYNQVTHAEGMAYLDAHLGRVPVVVAARVLRAWGLFEPLQQAQLDAVQSRSVGWQQLAWPASLLVLLAALPGFVLLRKNRLALVLVAGPVVVSTFVVAISFGNPRYVVAATPALCVAVGVTAMAVVDRRRRPIPSGRTEDVVA